METLDRGRRCSKINSLCWLCRIPSRTAGTAAACQANTAAPAHLGLLVGRNQSPLDCLCGMLYVAGDSGSEVPQRPIQQRLDAGRRLDVIGGPVAAGKEGGSRERPSYWAAGQQATKGCPCNTQQANGTRDTVYSTERDHSLKPHLSIFSCIWCRTSAARSDTSSKLPADSIRTAAISSAPQTARRRVGGRKMHA